MAKKPARKAKPKTTAKKRKLTLKKKVQTDLAAPVAVSPVALNKVLTRPQF
jgi:hypothetical protein